MNQNDGDYTYSKKGSIGFITSSKNDNDKYIIYFICVSSDYPPKDMSTEWIISQGTFDLLEDEFFG